MTRISKIFLDPDKTLYTCGAENCKGCEISERLVCHFNIKQLILFMLMAVPVLFVTGFFIYQFNPFLLIPWIIFNILFFGFIEIRVMCSHCPHYAEPGIKFLKCWANYGSPKLWKYRPGPMSIFEKVVFYAGFIIIFAPPVILLILQKSYLFLILYIMLITAWKLGLNVYYCNRCINFACPFNNVKSEIRDKFLKKNIDIGKAWKNRYSRKEGIAYRKKK